MAAGRVQPCAKVTDIFDLHNTWNGKVKDIAETGLFLQALRKKMWQGDKERINGLYKGCLSLAYPLRVHGLLNCLCHVT